VDQRGNNGVSAANLRGQGADATLVLLNGAAAHGLKGAWSTSLDPVRRHRARGSAA
jgi:hypothetical protein